MPGDPAIVVRRAEVRDADAIAATYALPRAVAGTLQLPFPSAPKWAKWIAEIAVDDHLLVAEVDGAVVGNLGLQPASKSSRRRHAGSIGITVRDDWHQRGVGSALLRAGIDLADNWIGYSRLELTVYTDNAPALALYRKFGFAIEGTARGYALRGGEFVDAYMMARHAPAPARVVEADARTREARAQTPFKP